MGTVLHRGLRLVGIAVLAAGSSGCFIPGGGWTMRTGLDFRCLKKPGIFCELVDTHWDETRRGCENGGYCDTMGIAPFSYSPTGQLVPTPGIAGPNTPQPGYAPPPGSPHYVTPPPTQPYPQALPQSTPVEPHQAPGAPVPPVNEANSAAMLPRGVSYQPYARQTGPRLAPARSSRRIVNSEQEPAFENEAGQFEALSAPEDQTNDGTLRRPGMSRLFSRPKLVAADARGS